MINKCCSIKMTWLFRPCLERPEIALVYTKLHVKWVLPLLRALWVAPRLRKSLNLNISRIRLRPKKAVCELVGWKNFYHLPAGISRMCMRIYIFVSKKYKKFSTRKFIRTNLRCFSLQTIKHRALCF